MPTFRDQAQRRKKQKSGKKWTMREEENHADFLEAK